jgi:aspartate beta-hydroxylase
MTDASDIRSLAAEGLAALKRGEPRAARDLLIRVTQVDEANAAVWFDLPGAYRQLECCAEESHALDQALKVDPNHLPALIGKGDVFARRGDEHAASAHYATALRLTNSLPFQPAEWRSELSRLAAARQRMSSNVETHLATVLAARGLGEAGTERAGHAVDLLLGKRQIFLQQPTNFYFPGLPQNSTRGATSRGENSRNAVAAHTRGSPSDTRWRGMGAIHRE